MATTRHIARAVGVTADSAPQWRVELKAGTHHLVADEPTDMAGGDAGPTPFGLLLCGLAAGTTMTLRMYAERQGWPLATIEVNVVFNIADDEQTSIDRTIALPSGLTEDQRAHLADVARAHSGDHGHPGWNAHRHHGTLSRGSDRPPNLLAVDRAVDRSYVEKS
jgi:putative redox protein